MNDTSIRLMKKAAAGYTCAQILVSLALEDRGETNAALVRAMAGLAHGCGTGQGSCGALTGAACVLALYAGKGRDGEEASERLPSMLQELTDWFRETVGERHGGLSCEAVTGEDGPEASRQKCGAIVIETYEKIVRILVANGFDPAG
ncbi:MAG: DVU_1555 family C-GCAxxG-C-C protein [Thermodesulfobacteriota bacterium]